MLQAISSSAGRKCTVKGGVMGGWAQHQSNAMLQPVVVKYKR